MPSAVGTFVTALASIGFTGGSGGRSMPVSQAVATGGRRRAAGSVAEGGGALVADPLPQGNRAGELGALDQPGGVELLGVEADGADEQPPAGRRSEEHTSELQSRQYLVCRLLLEKKKKIKT